MTFRNLGAFNRFIVRQKRDMLPEEFTRFHKRIALEVFRRVIFRSPVGNPSLWANPGSAPPGYVGGRFRGNWQISLSLNSSETGNTDASGAATVAQGFGSLAGVRDTRGRTIWIFNNVPYAQRLEQGWSSQAPGGIVSVTLAEVEAGIV